MEYMCQSCTCVGCYVCRLINLVQDDELELFHITLEVEGGAGGITECKEAQLETNLTYSATTRSNLTVGRSEVMCSVLEQPHSGKVRGHV